MHRTRWLAVVVAAGLFLIDRLTRTLAFQRPPQDLLGSFLRSEPTSNAGVALGIPVPSFLLVPILGLLIIVVVLVAIQAYRRSRTLAWWGALLIFAGAWSNLLDRFTYSAVRDFLRVSFWPTTGNLGDWMITVGAILLLVTSLRRNRPTGG